MCFLGTFTLFKKETTKIREEAREETKNQNTRTGMSMGQTSTWQGWACEERKFWRTHNYKSSPAASPVVRRRHMPVIPSIQEMREEDWSFEAILSCMVKKIKERQINDPVSPSLGKHLVAPCQRDGYTCMLIVTVFTTAKIWNQHGYQQIDKENKTQTQDGRPLSVHNRVDEPGGYPVKQ